VHVPGYYDDEPGRTSEARDVGVGSDAGEAPFRHCEWAEDWVLRLKRMALNWNGVTEWKNMAYEEEILACRLTFAAQKGWEDNGEMSEREVCLSTNPNRILDPGRHHASNKRSLY